MSATLTHIIILAEQFQKMSRPNLGEVAVAFRFETYEINLLAYVENFTPSKIDSLKAPVVAFKSSMVWLKKVYPDMAAEFEALIKSGKITIVG